MSSPGPLAALAGLNRGQLAVIALCLVAWCLLTSIALPGLASDAVARQLPDRPFRAISLATVGLNPLVDVMMLVFLMRYSSKRLWASIGDRGDLRHQRWVAIGVLLIAVVGAFGTVANLRVAGELGPDSVAPFAVGWGVITGTALTLGLGWIVARYGFHFSVERGWLFFFAADMLARWGFRWSAAWQRTRPLSLADSWPFLVEALILLGTVVLVILLINGKRLIPIQGPRGFLEKSRGKLPLHVLMASPLFTAAFASIIATGAVDLLNSMRGPNLTGPAFSGVLFLVGIGSVVFFQRCTSLFPSQLAEDLQRFQARIPGIRPGAATADYLGTHKRLLTAIAAPTFAALLVAPQLLETLLPVKSQVGLYGVQIVMITVIVLGAYQSVGENRRS